MKHSSPKKPKYIKMLESGPAPKVIYPERVIEGYAAMWTPDRVRDRIRKGAFAKTISERGPRLDPKTGKIKSFIKLGVDHEDIIGIPVHLEEDDTGLFYRGRVSKTQRGDEVLEQVNDGSLDMSSFAYDIIKSERINEPDADTELIELKVDELGPVFFACNEDTFMLGAKSCRLDTFMLGSKVYKLCTGDELTPVLDVYEDLKSGKPPKAVILGKIEELTAALAGFTQLLGVAGKEDEEESDHEMSADDTDEDEAKSIPTTTPVRAKTSQTPVALEAQAILEGLDPASRVYPQARMSQILEIKQMLEGFN